MPTLLQAIPTTYNGVTFRSRLEARHAVFMDTLGVEWHYEYEGYQLPSGWYVPDFWLPGLDAWLEIKGDRPTDQELQLAQELMEHTDKRVFTAYGPIPRDVGHCGDHYVNGECSESMWIGNWDWYYAWQTCTGCGKIDIQYQNQTYRICGDACVVGRKPHPGSAAFGGTRDPRILTAYHRARTYRFW